jgi:hypothetical protein
VNRDNAVKGAFFDWNISDIWANPPTVWISLFSRASNRGSADGVALANEIWFVCRVIIKAPKLVFAASAFFTMVLACSSTHGSLVFLYDFPGNPGSGIAANQTNPQPTGATFSDFTRTNLASVNAANVFASHNFSSGTSLDPTTYEGFSIAAASDYHLDLSSLTFNASIGSSGPQNIEVGLFLNGSTTAYATYDFSPTIATVAYTFNFTPLTDANNITSATFNFYGWNAPNTGGSFSLGNVGTNGSIVPEAPTLWPVVLLIGCILAGERLKSVVVKARPKQDERCDSPRLTLRGSRKQWSKCCGGRRAA